MYSLMLYSRPYFLRFYHIFTDSIGFSGKISSHWYRWGYSLTYLVRDHRLNIRSQQEIAAWAALTIGSPSVHH